jgi:hypothetical protein
MKTESEHPGRPGERGFSRVMADRSARRSRKVHPVRWEGDLDGVLQTPSAMLTLSGLTLGVFVSRKFFMIPLAVVVTLGQELLKERLIRALRVRSPR